MAAARNGGRLPADSIGRACATDRIVLAHRPVCRDQCMRYLQLAVRAAACQALDGATIQCRWQICCARVCLPAQRRFDQARGFYEEFAQFTSEIRPLLVMMLRTVTLVAPWRWCSS